MTEPYDLAIVGAGIIGLGAASAALDRGLRVVVVERATSIVGATVRNFGHIGVGAHAGEAGEYARRSRELWLRLAERAGFWVGQRGTLVLASTNDELAVLGEAGLPLLDADEAARLAPARTIVGGALLPDDLQVDPRSAAPAIAAHLQDAGVAFQWRTTAFGAHDGVLHTSRGEIRAENVLFALGHDVDQLFPELAEQHQVIRCGLDMMLTDGVGLNIPVLTGTSMLRYSAFADAPSLPAVRAHYEKTEPGVFTYDINQMYTERPDGTLLVGDSHASDVTIAPFQPEPAFELLHRLGEQLYGRPLRVRERWQGVYAKAPGEFLIASPADGVHVASVTTGSGMTCGLGLTEALISTL